MEDIVGFLFKTCKGKAHKYGEIMAPRVRRVRNKGGGLIRREHKNKIDEVRP